MKRSLTIVIKLGTSSIVDETSRRYLVSNLALIAETAVNLRQEGHKVVIVSSGAIGVALRLMNMPKRPKLLAEKQALAAIGQCRLMRLWDDIFDLQRQPVAQILLTRTDIADMEQFRNAQNAFSALLKMGVIPIVNENDTISVSEIKFGDNDTLAGITAGMVQADYLFLMTDVDCLYDKNPRTNPDAKPIEVVEDITAIEADTSSSGSNLGTGGMGTKIVAARLATSKGVTTIIMKSSNPGNVVTIVDYVESQKEKEITRASTPSTPSRSQILQQPGSADALRNGAISTIPAAVSIPEQIDEDEPLSPQTNPVSVPLHTRFLPHLSPIKDNYFWLLYGLSPRGSIYIDAGAYTALYEKHGLLPVGVVEVEGHFSQQEAVRLFVVNKPDLSHPQDDYFPHEHDHEPPTEVGRAVVNYSSIEIKRIKGLQSKKIREVLGYADSEYVALRGNISFFPSPSRPATPSFGRRPSAASNSG
ncbi:glutamate 5-kinase [Eremomyces bilateralis CBS 781.70]|uniref:Glutamate 5-kinase n=1 Tax=Eremomyces bilateralis CBS 781.70 TaxID=1392243 RepID=A0A6G1G1Q1_9PEZI|nr:glutamate 5-kinase [Eremomyces bilateralis CBS 781.70]KAF1811912.1 glutamate 5-kinase [Eremomyces bilateralis CBS 781.70]